MLQILLFEFQVRFQVKLLNMSAFDFIRALYLMEKWSDGVSPTE